MFKDKKNQGHPEAKKEAGREEKPEEANVTLKASEYQALLAEQEKSKELLDRTMRLQADYENARKRLEKEKAEFVKYANEEIILALLNVLDDLERSLEAAEKKHEDYEAFLKGVELILANLYELLKKNDVQPIEAKGKLFDPHLHEALLQVESEEFPEGTVIEELQKGYKLADRVIRTAKVKVAKAKEKKSNEVTT